MSDRLIASWQAEEREQPSGWSFADLESRMSTDPTPWDFQAVCVEALGEVGPAGRVLDMGTGGGETLLELREAALTAGVRFPVLTATEGWPPNVGVARATLAPFGIDVVEFGQPDDDPAPTPMPFANASFDLVLNRHEAYHPREVARVLAPGGTFLTQQVGGDELPELRDRFGHPAPAPGVTFEAFRDALLDAGLDVVDGATHAGRYRFADVAAVVAYAQRVPWAFPEDFAVLRYAEALLALHHESRGGEVTATAKRFWLRARLPAESAVTRLGRA